MDQDHKYEDIIHLSRPVSLRHAPMTMVDRGAQFSPFAALVGYDAVIAETARLTEQETFLDEDGKELLDRKLRRIAENMEAAGEITFLYFEYDGKKTGGKLVPVCGCVKRIDLYTRNVVLQNGREIPIDRIRAIEGVD